jgi:hypothetical protein
MQRPVRLEALVMAHLNYPYHRRTITRPHQSHVHFIAMLLLAAVVLIVTLGVRDHKPPPQPSHDVNTPLTAPRFH